MLETPELLLRLLTFDTPGGDEAPLADWLYEYAFNLDSSIHVERLGDSVLAVRGDYARTAVYAHIDTTGYTLGYDHALIPIGGPAAEPGDLLKATGFAFAGHTYQMGVDGDTLSTGETEIEPGSSLVFARDPVRDGSSLISPYLDNRAGAWAALQVLERCDNVAVAFTTGEEYSGHGARVCTRRLYEACEIDQALIADITWHTKHVRCGLGPAVSLRDNMVARRPLLNRVLKIAAESGIPYQREIERDGGSDGAHIEHSDFPVSWVFVGAPEEHPHSSHERVDLSDLFHMADLLTELVEKL